MHAVNINIAHQVRAALIENKEVAMSLRGLSEAKISLFFRNDSLQKLHFDDISYDLIGISEEDDFEGIPEDIYKNICMLIYNDIKELKLNLNHRTIVVGWKYDAGLEAFTGTSMALRKEYHFSRL